MQAPVYPFSAIVGQEKMRTALLLNAVDLRIGGVLISGHKGTGKSTAVRGLPGILPEITAVRDCPFNCDPLQTALMCESCHSRQSSGETLPVVVRPTPLVELPLSATEDRVVGTLHVEHALKTGGRVFDPGLMAAANRGILYVDEVNLLDDHLVDILLDAASSGVNIVEREGISHLHPAKFILVGTMNPEEGDLRPQFLDRFGLSLAVQSETDPSLRAAIARHRIAFDANHQNFNHTWRESQRLLAQHIRAARSGLANIEIPEAMFKLAVELSTVARVQGHRSDIAMLKTARALAALVESEVVQPRHMAEAARLVLPHRIAQTGWTSLEGLNQHIDELIRDVVNKPGTGSLNDLQTEDDADTEWDETPTAVPGAWAASNTDMVFSFLAKKKRYLTPMN